MIGICVRPTSRSSARSAVSSWTMARIRFAGKYYPLPDAEVAEFKHNLISLGTQRVASFGLHVKGKDGKTFWLWITPGAPVVIESMDEIPAD